MEIDPLTGSPLQQGFGAFVEDMRESGMVRVFGLCNEPNTLYLIQTNLSATVFKHMYGSEGYGPYELKANSGYFDGTMNTVAFTITGVRASIDLGKVSVVFWDAQDWQVDEWRKSLAAE